MHLHYVLSLPVVGLYWGWKIFHKCKSSYFICLIFVLSLWAFNAGPSGRPHIHYPLIHTSGIYQMNVSYCECDHYGQDGSHRQQVLWRRFPATQIEPNRVRRSVLEQFHMQNLQGKIAGYDFYSALEKLTDNAGLREFKVYFSFSRFRFIAD